MGGLCAVSSQQMDVTSRDAPRISSASCCPNFRLEKHLHHEVRIKILLDSTERRSKFFFSGPVGSSYLRFAYCWPEDWDQHWDQPRSPDKNESAMASAGLLPVHSPDSTLHLLDQTRPRCSCHSCWPVVERGVPCPRKTRSTANSLRG